MSPAPARMAAARTPGNWAQLAQVMSLSAGCALLSGVLSAGATKIIAVLAGPAAIGMLSTLQQIREMALTAATLNGGTALAQGASALSGRARASYLRTAAALFTMATGLAAIAMVVAPAMAPAMVARWAGLPAAQAGLIRSLSVAVVFSSGFVFLSSLVSALGAARRLAVLQLAGPGAMAVLAWPAARGNFAWLLAACAAATALAAVCALLPYRRRLAGWLEGGRIQWRDARHYFSIAGIMLATSLAGSAALLMVRANIVRAEGLSGGLNGVGQFDAAMGISMSQAALLLASLQTYYLPALAREPSAPERRALIRRALTLAAPASALAIAVLAAFKPFWLDLAYSEQFRAAAQYLRWTLLGDYLKVSSWIVSIPMLARADMGVFLASDLASAGCFLILARGLARSRSWPEAAAMAFVGMHAVHLAIGAVYVRRREGFRWSEVALPWLGGLAVASAVSLWRWNA